MSIEQLKAMARRAAEDLMHNKLSAPEVVMMSSGMDPVQASYFLIQVHDYVPYAYRRDLDNAIERHLRG